ncbi:ATP-binding protein [Deinococcus roseus]|uniref:Sensor histidine kinase n=1 Tax=Deinococcus roseus TaxID=392414 RepID=A0ABQ2D2D0_9DEIO|nr:sensor histidine kinase [Deinococcus roseus]GGJ43115.1 sensor histidine kinase [Deinococcus roseus]
MKTTYLFRPRSKMVSQTTMGKQLLTEEVVPPARKKRLNVSQRFFVMQLLLFSVLTGILGSIQALTTVQRTRAEYGERALVISQMVANVPTVIDYLNRPEERIAINPLMNDLREQVHADFLVVGSRLGIRYAHPFPEEISKHILSGDSKDDVLAETHPIVTGEGSLQNFIWGKASVHDQDGFVIGMVSTGFLLPTVQTVAWRVVGAILPWYGLSVVFALISSMWVSRRIRREMFNLEPEQIAGLVHQHRLVLGALNEGVLVLGPQGQVLLANGRAAGLLQLHTQIGPMLEWWPEWQDLDAQRNGDFEGVSLNFAGRPLLVSRFQLPDDQAVVVIRDREEAMNLAEELTQVRQYATMLRAQTHEFMNRLHTIGGLIQLERPELALEVVQGEVKQHQQIREIIQDIEIPQVAALLIGKHERARELGLPFEIDPLSHLQADWDRTTRDMLVLTLGNLIENAFEAALEHDRAAVRVQIAEDPEGLQLEVQDQAGGIPEDVLQRIFEQGFSSKGENRGYGLHLVQQQLKLVQGTIEYFFQDHKSIFRVSIPRREAPHD